MGWKIFGCFFGGFVIGAIGTSYIFYRIDCRKKAIYTEPQIYISEYAGIRYNDDGSQARMIGFGAN